MRLTTRTMLVSILVAMLAATLAVTGSTLTLAQGPKQDIHRPPADTSATQPRSASSPALTGRHHRYSHVLLIVEENSEYSRIIGNPAAPYINRLARRHGTARRMSAGYPTECPSLPAYLIMTSGSRHGICDDRSPSAHHIRGPNFYAQLAHAGKRWKQYVESMPGRCVRSGSEGVYLVRHAPAPYYTSEDSRCRRWDVHLGRRHHGPLNHALRKGRLPAFSMVIPNACHDMHGAGACHGDLVRVGDRWLSRWIPRIKHSRAYRHHRLVVIITWDEGSPGTNHIPTLVISPSTRHVVSTRRFTLCSVLRTMEHLTGVPRLGCAAHAPSMVRPFHLGGG